MTRLTDVNVWLHVALVLAIVLAVASVGSLGWLHDVLHQQSVETWHRMDRAAISQTAPLNGLVAASQRLHP